MGDYNPRYDTAGYGWPDGKNRRKRKNSSPMRERLLRLLTLQDNICFYCGKIASPTDANVDHVIPLSKKGSKDITNCVAAHVKCNDAKADRMPTDEELKRLSILHKEHR
jgi:5-methylcytosine-specific restriction endonuclease McrA